jgi:hypothetical protein
LHSIKINRSTFLLFTRADKILLKDIPNGLAKPQTVIDINEFLSIEAIQSPE